MSEHKPIVAFDCDGVLVDLLPGLCRITERLSGIPIQPDQWHDYSQYTQSGITHQAFLTAIVEDSVLENAVLNEGAVEVLAELSQQGFTIAVITSRGFHPDAERITQDYLTRNSLSVDHLMIVEIGQSKNQAIASLHELGEVIAYVDDYLPHLHDIAEQFKAIELFTMHQLWNRHDLRFERVHCLADYAEKITQLHADNELINR